jgi:hypothetical protein
VSSGGSSERNACPKKNKKPITSSTTGPKSSSCQTSPANRGQASVGLDAAQLPFDCIKC